MRGREREALNEGEGEKGGIKGWGLPRREAKSRAEGEAVKGRACSRARVEERGQKGAGSERASQRVGELVF